MMRLPGRNILIGTIVTSLYHYRVLLGHMVNLDEIGRNKTKIFDEKIYDWIRNGHFSSVLHLLGLNGARNDGGKSKEA